MRTQSETNRWWENYAVRYLMPSIAGVAIVRWLCSRAGPGLSSLLFVQPYLLNAQSLILLFLYGNLFCYLASYPALAFHAVRVVHYGGDNYRWTVAHVLNNGAHLFDVRTLCLGSSADSALGSVCVGCDFCVSSDVLDLARTCSESRCRQAC